MAEDDGRGEGWNGGGGGDVESADGRATPVTGRAEELDVKGEVVGGEIGADGAEALPKKDGREKVVVDFAVPVDEGRGVRRAWCWRW